MHSGVEAFDPVAQDPPPDDAYPASTPSMVFESAGSSLLGVLHLPAGRGPHPLVVLCHGFPGWERNLDLAQILRRSGYATLVFHYRGSWGSSGSWTWWNCVEDTHSVLDAIAQGRLGDRVDTARCALVGHSFGGFVALQAASRSRDVKAVVSFSGFDFGVSRRAIAADPSARDAQVADWAGELAPLTDTTAEQLVDEMLQDDHPWSLSELAPQLRRTPLLLIGSTDRDPVTPAEHHHFPLVESFRSQGVELLEDEVFSTDHALSDHRVRVARRIVEFLARHIPVP